MKVRSVCVYCGSGTGHSPGYAVAARQLGRALAKNNICLVFGGGSLGLMGELSRAAREEGGKIVGVIPSFLKEREAAFDHAGELIVTADMHERKGIMFERADAIVALPGGIGTLEELVEVLTWSQLGQSEKPLILANIEKYWDPFLALISHMRVQGFIRPDLEIPSGQGFFQEESIAGVLAQLGVPEPDD